MNNHGALLILWMSLLLGCGKQAPEQQAKVPDANPPAQPPVKEAEQPPVKPKVVLTEAKLTPGMKAAYKAHEAGNYREAVRLYTMELAAEEAKPAPSWVQLSYLHNQLGSAMDYAGLYDQALEYLQKSLAIRLKQLGPEHPEVATSYNNIGLVHYNKGEYDQTLEHFQKSLAILLKQLGPEHPHVATSYNNMAYSTKTRRIWPKSRSIGRRPMRFASRNWAQTIPIPRTPRPIWMS